VAGPGGAAGGHVLLAARSDHKVLFSNLSEKDGAVVIAKLDQMGVDYKFADGGGSILVPGSRCTNCA
jgi:flagellar M-ring protein FliF